MLDVLQRMDLATKIWKHSAKRIRPKRSELKWTECQTLIY